MTRSQGETRVNVVVVEDVEVNARYRHNPMS